MCAQTKTQISLGIRMKKIASLAIKNTVNEVWSDSENVQADMNIRCVHVSDGTFSKVAAYTVWCAVWGKFWLLCTFRQIVFSVERLQEVIFKFESWLKITQFCKTF